MEWDLLWLDLQKLWLFVLILRIPLIPPKRGLLLLTGSYVEALPMLSIRSWIDDNKLSTRYEELPSLPAARRKWDL